MFFWKSGQRKQSCSRSELIRQDCGLVRPKNKLKWGTKKLPVKIRHFLLFACSTFRALIPKAKALGLATLCDVIKGDHASPLQVFFMDS